jgi:hypothetical protein
MELTPAQRLITFALVVLVLAGLGVYLFLPQSNGASAAGRPAGSRPGSSASPSARPVSGSTEPSSGPSSSPSSGPPSTAAKAPDIYAWLPFTESGLASAAQVTTKFAADYGTFSYRQDTASYLAPMKSIITGQLAELIGRAYSAPGVVASRTSAKQVCVGSGVITSLRAFGPSSLTFLVTLNQRITSTAGPKQESDSYAITVTGGGPSWQVSNIEFASAGNQ